MNENKPTFSVVIPLYNKEKHIRRAIDSVLNQDYKDFNIIIIDDGSSDSSREIVENYKDTQIKYFRQENQGVSIARNNGIKYSSGDYIALLDADDEWTKTHLSDILTMIKKYPNSGIYATAYMIVDEKGLKKKLWEDEGNSIYPIDFFKETYPDKKLPITASSVCIPKDMFIKYGFFQENHPRGEDLDLWARIALFEEVIFYRKSSSIYYKNSENRSIQKINIEEYPFINTYKNLSYNDKNLTTKIYVKEFVAMQQFIRSKVYIFSNQGMRARKVLLKTRTKIQKIKWLYLFFISFLPLDFIYYIKSKRK